MARGGRRPGGGAGSGAGAAVLPGPWHAALPIAFCGGLVAVILAWTTVPAARREDFEAAGPGTVSITASLVLLPVAVATGGLVRLGLHLAWGAA